MKKRYKIVIFGGGPVGQCLAHILNKGDHDYIIIEKNEKIQDKFFYLQTIHQKNNQQMITHKISMLRWYGSEGYSIKDFLLCSDFVFICVGIFNVSTIGKCLVKYISRSKRRPPVILFENDSDPEISFLNGFPNYPVDKINFSISDVIAYKETTNHTRVLYPFNFFISNRNLLNKLESKYFKYQKHIKVAFLQRLYSHNTAHNMVAYLGFFRGYKTIRDAIKNSWIKQMTEKALNEAAIGISKKFKISLNQQKRKSKIEISKLLCKNFNDPIIRVARSPLRKLRRNDRLVGPAMLAYKAGVFPEYLCLGIAFLFLFKDHSDEESLLLNNLIKKRGFEYTFKKYSGLNIDHPIAIKVKSIYLHNRL